MVNKLKVAIGELEKVNFESEELANDLSLLRNCSTDEVMKEV